MTCAFSSSANELVGGGCQIEHLLFLGCLGGDAGGTGTIPAPRSASPCPDDFARRPRMLAGPMPLGGWLGRGKLVTVIGSVLRRLPVRRLAVMSAQPFDVVRYGVLHVVLRAEVGLLPQPGGVVVVAGGPVGIATLREDDVSRPER